MAGADGLGCPAPLVALADLGIETDDPGEDGVRATLADGGAALPAVMPKLHPAHKASAAGAPATAPNALRRPRPNVRKLTPACYVARAAHDAIPSFRARPLAHRLFSQCPPITAVKAYEDAPCAIAYALY